MARLFTSGGETGSTEWNGGGSISTLAPSVTAALKRTGDYSINFPAIGTAGPSYLRQIFDDNQTALYGRFALRVDSSVYSRDVKVMAFHDSSNGLQFYLRFVSGTGALEWYSGANTTLGIGTVIVPADTWVVCEFHAAIATSGSLTLKINGTTASTYTGDTDYTNVGNVRSVYIGCVALTGASTGPISIAVDDIAINNAEGSYQNSWVGLGGVFYLQPTADGDQTDWTPSAGTVNYAMVDDVPPDNATTFVQAEVPGSIDLYELEDTPAYVDSVDLVQVVYRVALTTAGSNQTTDLVKISGTVYSGTAYTITSLTPNFAYYFGTPHYLSPNTGSAWGTAEVSAMQAGLEITA